MTRRSIIHVGYVCNLRCKHCYYYGMNPSKRKWKKLLWLMAHLVLIRLCRLNKVDVSGGEPTLYPHMEFLADFASLIGFKEMRLVTNGTQVDRALWIARNPIVKFSLSWHSHRDTDLEMLTGQRGMTAKLTAFVSQLRDKINYINCVITPYNTDVEHIAQALTGMARGIPVCFKHLDYNFQCGIDDWKISAYQDKLNWSISRALREDPSAVINMRFYPFCFLEPELIEHPRVKCCSAITNTYDDNDWLPLISRKTSVWRYIKFIFGNAERRLIEAKAQAVIQGASECAHGKPCKSCRYVNFCDGTQKGYLRRFGDSELRAIV